ncbi:flavodoxin [Priestia taiwanensis]|uniref:Flavodoxin n=1 Tax=Priestia taiwanensis TaxID=1347902 RepID=A0A917AQT0_9BACI|nr:flavodoxin [Priestia taiwanensis]MBM7362559.1 flavodoxin I [Priestia taiwanensis]GGE63221.1 flavodoxin [Priestia taiwanensis]
MSDILIVYASMTGNTEQVATILKETIEEAGLQVEMQDCLQVTKDDVLAYEGILIGGYTWGDGDLPDELIDLYEDILTLDLTGKLVASFGTGDTAYGDTYCLAVKIIQEGLKGAGATIALEGLEVENYPEGDDEEACKEFAKEFAKQFQERG